jgi:hypothetical protein
VAAGNPGPLFRQFIFGKVDLRYFAIRRKSGKTIPRSSLACSFAEGIAKMLLPALGSPS